MGKSAKNAPPRKPSKPSSAEPARKRKLAGETFVWEGTTLRVKYEPSWIAGSDDRHALAHLEVEVIEPKGAPLPITETGYRSHFLGGGIVEGCGGPSAYVRNWLEESARSPAWRKALDRWRQLSLF